MKIVLISCFGYYDQRLKYVEKYFDKNKHDIRVVFSDYDHIKKVKITDKLDFVDYIHAPEYTKNISVKRLYSHFAFAKGVYKYLRKEKPDFVYSIVPPNSLVKYISKYRRKSNSRVVFDIYDLWPETMPFGKDRFKLLSLPFNIWRGARDNYLKYADAIITECNLYRKVLSKQFENKNVHTIYLTSSYDSNIMAVDDSGYLEFGYLGSMNNIIDIDAIISLLVAVNKQKKIRFSLIGDGESREILIKQLEKHNIEYIYYGKIFDTVEKINILSKCDFGLNIMKSTVCIGLTMKSIDYFSNNLPIINNISADTSDLVEEYKAGFNVNANNMEELAKVLAGLSKQEILEMKRNVHRLQNDHFKEDKYLEKFDEVFKSIQKADALKNK